MQIYPRSIILQATELKSCAVCLAPAFEADMAVSPSLSVVFTPAKTSPLSIFPTSGARRSDPFSICLIGPFQ